MQTQFPEQQIDRLFYDGQGRLVRQVHTGHHGKPKLHPYGQHGEHGHDFIRDETGKIIDRTTRELTDEERKENSDIL